MLARSFPRALAASAFAALLTAGLAIPGSASPASDPAPDTDQVDADLWSALQRDLGLSAEEARERLADDAEAAVLAETLRGVLGSAYGGAWLEHTGRLVVGTTDPDAASRIRAAGAEPRLVARDATSLNEVVRLLDARAAESGVPEEVTGWHVDPVTNSVVVSALDPAAAQPFVSGLDGVRVEKVNARPMRLANLIGGEALETSDGGRCSIGFNATVGGIQYVITAGHCTNTGGTWYGENGSPIGPVAESQFPGDDFGLIEVTSSGWVQTPFVAARRGTVTITGTTPAPVGASVCRSGSSSGYRCGTVEAVNETINYGGGDIVNGLTRTSACAQPGDSGGPFVAGNQAQGVLSGGLGGCLLGGETYFQPVVEVLERYGLTLVTGGRTASDVEEDEAPAPSQAPGLLPALPLLTR